MLPFIPSRFMLMLDHNPRWGTMLFPRKSAFKNLCGFISMTPLNRTVPRLLTAWKMEQRNVLPLPACQVIILWTTSPLHPFGRDRFMGCACTERRSWLLNCQSLNRQIWLDDKFFSPIYNDGEKCLPIRKTRRRQILMRENYKVRLLCNKFADFPR